MRKDKVMAYISIIRPANSLMVGTAVIIGVMLTSLQMVLSWKTLYGFLTGFFVSAFSMVVNDIYDVEVDKKNKLTRPLVVGIMRIKEAWIYAFILLIIGLVLSFATNIEAFMVATLFGFISWWYNFTLKRHGIIGNMTVALSTSIPYIYGSMISTTKLSLANIFQEAPLVPWFVGISFLAVTGREVIKTISDIEGDQIREVRSIALWIGKRNAAKVGVTFFVLAILFTFGPYILGQAGIAYMIMILVPDVVFIYISYLILIDQSVKSVLYVKKLALFGMLLGFVAFVVGRVLMT
ncbi:MAG: UbiA family prenyltransferase [Nitrososphaeria archaeon]